MNADLEKLIELEKVDREIARLSEEVAALPRRVAAIEGQLAEHKAAVEKAKAAIKNNESSRRKLEADSQNPVHILTEFGTGYRFVPGGPDTENPAAILRDVWEPPQV